MHEMVSSRKLLRGASEECSQKASTHPSLASCDLEPIEDDRSVVDHHNAARMLAIQDRLFCILGAHHYISSDGKGASRVRAVLEHELVGAARERIGQVGAAHSGGEADASHNR